MLIKNRGLGIIHLGEQATLLPGVNNVPDKVWNGFKDKAGNIVDGYKDHDTVKIMLDEEIGMLEVMAANGLTDMTVPEAVRTVKMTVDSALLDNWAKDDKRKPVLLAIQEQKQKVSLEEAQKKAP